MLIKVINGREISQPYWMFFAALTTWRTASPP